MTKELDNILDLTPVEDAFDIKKPTTTKPDVTGNSYQDAKAGIQDAAQIGAEALAELSFLARSDQHPRHFEALTDLIKAVVEANKELYQLEETKLNIKKKEQDVEGEVPNGAINNNLFVGSTSELLEIMKEKNVACKKD